MYLIRNRHLVCGIGLPNTKFYSLSLMVVVVLCPILLTACCYARIFAFVTVCTVVYEY